MTNGYYPTYRYWNQEIQETIGTNSSGGTVNTGNGYQWVSASTPFPNTDREFIVDVDTIGIPLELEQDYRVIVDGGEVMRLTKVQWDILQDLIQREVDRIVEQQLNGPTHIRKIRR